MKTPKINSIRFILILACCTIFLGGKKIETQIDPNNPNHFKRFFLFVKIEDATIKRENAGRKWYTWKNALINEFKSGQNRSSGKRWCTLYTDNQTVMKLDSAIWELFVNATLLGDDGEKINIKYHSFDIPTVTTESKKYGWIANASCEAGGKFYKDGYMFEMTFYEQPMDFKFRHIPATANWHSE